MSNKIIRKENYATQRSANTCKEEIKKLEDLKADLENKLKKQNSFGHTSNFLAPFVLTAGITVGAFKLFGGGLPFYIDDITKYKIYNLEFDTEEHVTMYDEYITNRWFHNSIPSNSLVIYSPWKEQNGQYTRFKRVYNIGKLTSFDLYDAVLNADYGYIEQNVKDYKEEIQTTNYINEEEPNDYIFQASLHLLDKNDTLVYNESDLRNIIITIIEVVLGLSSGSLIAYFRNFKYLSKKESINDNYQCTIIRSSSTKKELENNNQKILSLRKTKGGR